MGEKPDLRAEGVGDLVELVVRYFVDKPLNPQSDMEATFRAAREELNRRYPNVDDLTKRY